MFNIRGTRSTYERDKKERDTKAMGDASLAKASTIHDDRIDRIEAPYRSR